MYIYKQRGGCSSIDQYPFQWGRDINTWYFIHSGPPHYGILCQHQGVQGLHDTLSRSLLPSLPPLMCQDFDIPQTKRGNYTQHVYTFTHNGPEQVTMTTRAKSSTVGCVYTLRGFGAIQIHCTHLPSKRVKTKSGNFHPPENYIPRWLIHISQSAQISMDAYLTTSSLSMFLYKKGQKYKGFTYYTCVHMHIHVHV